jgi:uncharacterized protein (TIGR02246 family)
VKISALALFATAALAWGCGNSIASPADDIASATPVMDRADAEWLGIVERGDADAVAAPYADDGVFVLPDGRVLTGRQAIADFYRERFSHPRKKIVDGGIHKDGTAAAEGGLVYEWGHGGVTVVDSSGKQTASEGPYLTVWKRDAAGEWKIIRNMSF